METKKCPKCEGGMEEGFIPDYLNLMWDQKGTWKKSGQKIIRKATPEDYHDTKVVTFRCKSCGFLESYAK
ncbi:hypothetical protein CO051_06040 [Candidatus Roizmanbacteria bacterium CG_4_9_14_0_2_um_filter_39_13]|uniref:DUF6487 domain-containing protein n=2 Tax=Candidatus Roizmaniibacteriota TaxID=1752723 RepID=A0A2M8EWY8_9BACT|nr:MAG: hypothetical protein COY15_04505 [Candidatus Roizmanbacteria bacterium CG_4_10_14_0_2_um_filter_39_12]PJC30383.1 MAG: hypothetical protein CO051_06040 [Candidatus Roizmanbacteria bacterium CG_4_9_14_0_2_um_filter_39_13]PJE61335.1 MAG: hypothetical protein COU87_05230 [Candidatus Roizmanbacteria bacterium CG10_big_fil_rev_8_21_14_0_10_39_12]